MANSTDYKKLKEDFVSGLSGGPIGEINYVTAVAPVATFLWSALQARQGFFQGYYGPMPFAVDYLVNVTTILLSFTLYARSPLLLSILLILPALLIWVLPPTVRPPKKQKKPPVGNPTGKNTSRDEAAAAAGAADTTALSKKPFLTTYRGSMMVSTCLAILAVDFRLFPRRFAKVETWGTSLMDLGVGSFVFSAGVVAARPVLRDRALAKISSASPSRLIPRLLGSLRHSLPLLALGLVRTLSVKGLEYQEHVTEYGVHWNFFFTLGFLPPFVAGFQSALRLVPSYAVLSLVLAGAYQAALEATGLKAYVLAAPRTDLLSMNREGLASFVGYLAIFLAGQHAGMYLLPRNIDGGGGGGSRWGQRKKMLLRLATWSAAWTALFLASTSDGYGPGWVVSRRLANLPYVLWIAAFNSAQLLGLCLIDTVCFPASYAATDPRAEEEAYTTATSRLLRALNRNGLPLFLVANLLTGLVNMTVRTLEMDQLATVGILVAYSAVISVVAVILDAYNISIKL